MSGIQKKYLSILPNNVPASGRVAPARGHPIITMMLGRQDAMLDLSSLRLSGDLNVWADAARTLHPTNLVAAELRGSHKLGIYSAIDSIVFRHAETKAVVEQIRHYGRFMSSLLPSMASNSDMTTHLTETALIMPNYKSHRDTVIRNTGASPFCIPLPAGLTLGTDGALPLSKFPIEIEIHLASDSQFFYSSDATTANIANSFYELSGLEFNSGEGAAKTLDMGIQGQRKVMEGIINISFVQEILGVLVEEIKDKELLGKISLRLKGIVQENENAE